MRLCRKVDDTVHLLVLHELVEGVEVADIHLHELIVRHTFHILQIGEVAGISKLVKVDDIVLGVLVYEKSHYMAADEAGAACDHYASFKSHII